VDVVGRLHESAGAEEIDHRIVRVMLGNRRQVACDPGGASAQQQDAGEEGKESFRIGFSARR
jgi:hypothetical protein